MNDPLWEFYGQPYEPPPSMDYQIGPREFASVTAMGNWYSMQADRDRWREIAESIAKFFGNEGGAELVYKDVIAFEQAKADEQ